MLLVLQALRMWDLGLGDREERLGLRRAAVSGLGYAARGGLEWGWAPGEGYGWAVVTPADLRWAVFSASRVA